MGCNVAELGYMRPRRGIWESDDILAKDRIELLPLRLNASKIRQDGVFTMDSRGQSEEDWH